MSRTAYGVCPALVANCRIRNVDVRTSARTLRAADRGRGAVSTVDAVEAAVPDVLATDEARGLLEAGREAGSLSADEIALALDDLDLDAGQMDEFYAALDELHIEVVEAEAEDETPVVDDEVREISTDSLQLFLKDIGKVELLTAAQEVELAKRIERGDMNAKRRVLELRYGLDGQHPRTLDEVGRTFNVTRERIRQIENQSLKKLRALADAQKLREVA